MKIMQRVGRFLCADGKFFVVVATEGNEEVYRQIELYLPGSTGCYGEPLEVTATRYLQLLDSQQRPYKWAIGSTGGQMTARWRVRADGELVSELSLKGGMK